MLITLASVVTNNKHTLKKIPINKEQKFFSYFSNSETGSKTIFSMSER